MYSLEVYIKSFGGQKRTPSNPPPAYGPAVLGPLLFLIYIDQVASSVTYSNITMYADDIAMYKIISNPSDYTYLQKDILSLCPWIANNYLTLNFQKCRYMIFTRKHQPTFPTSDLHMNDHHALVKTDHYKYLGLNLFPDLSCMVSPH